MQRDVWEYRRYDDPMDERQIAVQFSPDGIVREVLVLKDYSREPCGEPGHESRRTQGAKARAHSLDPVVHLGEKGLTEPVMAEIDRALAAPELIKVRAGGLDRDEREAAFEEICACWTRSASSTSARSSSSIAKPDET